MRLWKQAQAAGFVPFAANTHKHETRKTNVLRRPENNQTAEIKTTGLPPKVVIIGRAAVGKTSLIHKYRSDIFHENGFSATVGAAVFSEKYHVMNDPDRKSDEPYKLMFWDTAGAAAHPMQTTTLWCFACCIACVYMCARVCVCLQEKRNFSQ